MRSQVLRQVPVLALILGFVACGDHGVPTAPAAAKPAIQAVAPGAAAPEVAMPVNAQGSRPPGFVASFRVDPRPGADGVIRGDSPITVEFDMCGSRTDADKTLTFLYDWDFDNVADAVGSGDACKQRHTYNGTRVVDADGNGSFRTNVCVVSGNPRTPTSPDTFYGCRPYTISTFAGFAHHTAFGQTWFNAVPTGTYTQSQAIQTCQAFNYATHRGFGECNTGCGCSAPEECVFDTVTLKTWFFAGPFARNATPFTCDFGDIWD